MKKLATITVGALGCLTTIIAYCLAIAGILYLLF